MITLIHGADTANSRNYLNEEKKRNPDHILLEADTVNLTDLTQIFQGGGLFGEPKNIFIEQYITKKKKTSDFPAVIAYLNENAKENTIILWEAKELEISMTKLLSQPIMRVFKLPQTLFVLTDSLKPGNGKTLINLFHQTAQNTEIEMIFFMLVRQIRLLLALNTTPTDMHSPSEHYEEIDELKRMAPWQKKKLIAQANLFSQEKLLTLYEKLYTIEVGQKTGGLQSSTAAAIDFLLLEV